MWLSFLYALLDKVIVCLYTCNLLARWSAIDHVLNVCVGARVCVCVSGRKRVNGFLLLSNTDKINFNYKSDKILICLFPSNSASFLYWLHSHSPRYRIHRYVYCMCTFQRCLPFFPCFARSSFFVQCVHSALFSFKCIDQIKLQIIKIELEISGNGSDEIFYALLVYDQNSELTNK